MTAELRTQQLRGPDSVLALRDSIEELCRDLAYPNIFYEPWFLFPALKHLGRDKPLHFLCVYETGGGQRLCGFLPLIESRLHPYLPLKTFEAWAHSQCFRCTPLVRHGFAEQFWRAILSWLEGCPWHRRLLRLRKMPAEGELWCTLQRALAERPSFRRLSFGFDTSFLDIGPSYDETIKMAMSRETRRKIKQMRKRLDKVGQVTFEDIDDGPPADTVIEEFLHLEASGWKGRSGTALGMDRDEAALYRDVIRAAYDRKRLTFLSLRLDGRMIAGRCAFMAATGAFAFKVAYDESFARYSPGTLLELDELRRLHDPEDRTRAELTWCDSCAMPGDGPTYRCWPGHMPVARYLIAPPWTPHALAIALWSLAGKLRPNRRGAREQADAPA